eukprot:scaffold53323_cov29-Prasinocladus_malaysianus.AAC.1
MATCNRTHVPRIRTGCVWSAIIQADKCRTGTGVGTIRPHQMMAAGILSDIHRSCTRSTTSRAIPAGRAGARAHPAGHTRPGAPGRAHNVKNIDASAQK